MGRIPAVLVERGNWAMSTAYVKGDVVTYSYTRWYCKTNHNSLSGFNESFWIHLGLYAVGATSDPGVAGRLWVDVS